MIPQTLKEELSTYCSHYASRRVGLITVMQKVQEHYGGWLPDEAVAEVAEIVGVDTAEVEGCASFYNWLFREPVGKKVIVYCDSASCYLCGCDRIAAHLKERLGVEIGQTTADGRYTLLPVVCLGNCDHAPSIMIGDELYGDLTPEKLDEILDQDQPKAGEA